jgi:hypothetical protein
LLRLTNETPAERVLAVWPSLSFIIDKTRKRTFGISPDGLVNIPESFATSSRNTTLNVDFLLPEGTSGKPCWDITAVLAGRQPSVMQCDSTGTDHLSCDLPVLETAVWLQAGGKVSFEIAPAIPNWLGLIPEGHSLRLTFSSFRRLMTRPTKIAVMRRGAQPINSLVIQASGSD